MQGHRTLAQRRASQRKRTLAEFLAAGELTCSAADVARWLNVSKPTVIAAARRGDLPGRQVGKQWRFSTRALAHMWSLDIPSPDRSSPSGMMAGGGSDAA
jgi:excisionase family DNA binding protein